jgi:hypothetical protein
MHRTGHVNRMRCMYGRTGSVTLKPIGANSRFVIIVGVMHPCFTLLITSYPPVRLTSASFGTTESNALPAKSCDPATHTFVTFFNTHILDDNLLSSLTLAHMSSLRSAPTS